MPRTAPAFGVSIVTARDCDRRYAAALSSGALFDHYEVTSMRILTVVDAGPVRRQHLQRYCTAAVPKALRSYFWFARLADLAAQTIVSAPVWTVAGRGEERRGLMDLDFA